jgi:hypothetical protein
MIVFGFITSLLPGFHNHMDWNVDYGTMRENSRGFSEIRCIATKVSSVITKYIVRCKLQFSENQKYGDNL